MIEQLRTLPDRIAQCVVTSPPYYGLRDYKLPPSVWSVDGWENCSHDWLEGSSPGISGGATEKQITNVGSFQQTHYSAFCQECNAWRGCLGQEPTPELFTLHLVQVFRELRRVLRDDGVAWLNLGDSYAGSAKGWSPSLGEYVGSKKQSTNAGSILPAPVGARPVTHHVPGRKDKDLIGIPWLVAFALQADGWWLRSDVVWAKPNVMPESVNGWRWERHRIKAKYDCPGCDQCLNGGYILRRPAWRPTRSHEFIFMLAKSPSYYCDKMAVLEPLAEKSEVTKGRNNRDVWFINNKAYKGAHFAVFPTALVETCILAATPPDVCSMCDAPYARASQDDWWPTCKHKAPSRPAIVLDPFCGSGTTGLVAKQHGRNFIGIELNPHYVQLAEERISRG